MIVPDSTRSFFHISTRLNRGSFLPEKYADLDVLTDKLAGFSFNYYGARYINDAERGTYIDPEFDLLFNFSKKNKAHRINQNITQGSQGRRSSRIRLDLLKSRALSTESHQ